MYAWQFQKAMNIAKQHNWSTFVSMQNHLNLLYREEEREMLPYCKDAKVGVTPYSPLASGRLVRDVTETTKRLTEDAVAKMKYDSTMDSDRVVIERVAEVAQNRGLSKTQVALAWLLHKDTISAPIVGATKLSHLDEAVSSIPVKLSNEEIQYLEEPYTPHVIVGHN